MENTMMPAFSDCMNPLLVTDVELLKQYTAIIQSWVWDIGKISDITLCESMLQFSHDGCINSCPMEPEVIYRTKVNIANQIEERAAYV